MKPTLLLLLSAAIAFAWFGPNVRIDHQDSPTAFCHRAAITVGPSTGSGQPLYVAFEYDSTWIGSRGDIMFQKSTDAGRTWLPADVLARRGNPGAVRPDITTDSDGNIYVVFNDVGDTSKHLCCVRSTDGGATWSSPTKVDDRVRGDVGSARIAADSAGNLLCAWNDNRTGSLHIWSSVSTDRGATWSQNVQVDDDTTYYDCYHADVFVQPGTNHYLVAAQVPYYDGYWNHGSYLYRSTDMGQTFQPGVRLNTNGYAGQPHVVADAQHVVCDYTDNGSITEARTLYTQPDTWGVPHFIGTSYANGAKLAISADGRVHTALMARHGGEPFLSFYALSSDHGVTWSEPELVNDDTTADRWDPDIAADSAGHANVVWEVDGGEVWFSTNNPAAIAEQPSRQRIGVPPLATVIRNVLFLPMPSSVEREASSVLLDIGGRKLMDLTPGPNDVSRLSPGVYFVREAQAQAQAQAQAVRKVIKLK